MLSVVVVSEPAELTAFALTPCIKQYMVAAITSIETDLTVVNTMEFVFQCERKEEVARVLLVCADERIGSSIGSVCEWFDGVRWRILSFWISLINKGICGLGDYLK